MSDDLDAWWSELCKRDKEWRDEVKSWLLEKHSVQDVEQTNIYDGRPFGSYNMFWEELKAYMNPGDEIWSYRRPGEDREHLCPRAGYALVRDGQVITDFVTEMS
jgi:hypothetical protein